MNDNNSKIEITSISVDRKGTWLYKGKEMVNKEILSYFKKNLQKDEKGIYILNQYKNLKEKGYIQVDGPLLKIIDIQKNSFLLENEDMINFKNMQIIFDEDLHPYVFIEKLQAWAMFSRNRYIEFMNLLEENQKNADVEYKFQNYSIPIQKNIIWTNNLK